MAWGSKILKQIRDATGLPDTSSHTVKLQPWDQSYPTGAVSLSQMSGDLSIYGIASDLLDDDTHYMLYIDDTDTGIRYYAPNTYPPFMG